MHSAHPLCDTLLVGKLCDFYDTGLGDLGEGGFGTVKMAMCRSSRSKRAVKHICRAKIEDTRKFKQEIKIMKITYFV